MAKEQNKPEPPAFIDYETNSDSEPIRTYTSTHFIDYWNKQLVRRHRVAPLPLTLKEKSLWKRLYTQFGADELKQMIDNWMDIPHEGASACKFVSFYMRRDEFYDKVKETDYGWD